MAEYFINEKISDSIIIDACEIPFDEKSRQYCSANLCGEYGRTWTCPPAAGETAECIERVKSFDKAFVFTHKGFIADMKDSLQIDILRNETMGILYSVCEKLRKDGVCHLALGCSGCKFCEKCTYPDAPCRFPEKAVYPAEAFCVDVASLAEKVGFEYLAGENIVTFFCIILFEELK